MTIKITVEDPALQEMIAKGGQPLADLCHKEADNFDAYCKQYGGMYRDGLCRIERIVLEGYLEWKLRSENIPK